MDYKAYIDWTKSLKLEFPNGELDIKNLNDEATERCIIWHDIKKDGPVLVRLPFESTMSIMSAVGTPLGCLINACREEDMLVLLLLYEKFVKQEKSKWAPHIAILPDQYHNIVNYTNDEIDTFLKGSNLCLLAKKWKIQIKNDYDDLKMNLEANQTNLLLDKNISTWFHYDNYIWGLSTIWSRFISIQRKDKNSNAYIYYKAMVPFVDIFNHSMTSKCSHMYSERNNQFMVIRDKSQTWQKGDEICLNYGLVSNSKLLMLYGFALLDNPYCHVDVYVSLNYLIDDEEKLMSPYSTLSSSTSPPTTTTVTTSDNNDNNVTNTTTILAINTMKIEALKQIGIINLEEPFPIYENIFPSKFMSFLRIQHNGEDDENNQNIKSKNNPHKCDYTVKNLVEASQISNFNDCANSNSIYIEKKICKVLIQTLQTMLLQYSAVISEDEIKLQQWGLLPVSNLPRTTTCTNTTTTNNTATSINTATSTSTASTATNTAAAANSITAAAATTNTTATTTGATATSRAGKASAAIPAT